LADRQASHKPHLLDLFLLAKRPEVIPVNKRKKLPKMFQFSPKNSTGLSKRSPYDKMTIPVTLLPSIDLFALTNCNVFTIHDISVQPIYKQDSNEALLPSRWKYQSQV